MKTKILDLLTFILSLQLLGCANLYSIGPSALVESPEVLNHKTGEVSFFVRAEPGQYFNLVNDASSRPLNVKNPPELKQQVLLTGGANLSLSKQIEAGGAFDFGGLFNSSLLTRGQLKIQLAGVPEESAPPSPHRFAVYGHPILGTVAVGGDQDGTWGPGGYPWHAKSKFLGFNYGMSYGYRFSDTFMVYTGAAKENHSLEASVTQDEGRSNSPAAFARLPKTKGHSLSYALGIINTGASRFNGAIYYIENKWNGQQDNIWFLSLGFEIDKLKQAKTSPSEPSQAEKPTESAPKTQDSPPKSI